MQNLVKMIHEDSDDVIEKADRRLLLMLKQDKKIKVCQFCFRHLKWDGKKKKMIGHAEDCEWGKELADD